MKKIQNKKNSHVRKSKHAARESTGMNIVVNIGSVEMLRHPEFWR